MRGRADARALGGRSVALLRQRVVRSDAAGGDEGDAVTRETLRWSADVCRIGRSYRTDDTLCLEAFCADKVREHGIPVSLRLYSDHISLVWKRAARGELRRRR